MTALNPFANKAKKVSSSKNPFARTAGMTRDRSMHKSTSFFDRVDASMDNNAKDTTSQKSKGNKVKQSTLFSSMTRTKPNGPAATPAFASQQEEDDNDDNENLKLTLEAAARKDEASLQMEETQYQAEESQFDSLPIDVSV